MRKASSRRTRYDKKEQKKKLRTLAKGGKGAVKKGGKSKGKKGGTVQGTIKSETRSDAEETPPGDRRKRRRWEQSPAGDDEGGESPLRTFTTVRKGDNPPRRKRRSA